jgi:hypothetical protein
MYTASGLTLCQTRWHQFWKIGDTSFVSAGLTASCLNSQGYSGTDFHYVCYILL